MKKVIAINGSPRKNGNTAMLLENALNGAKSKGADIEIVNLVDLNFKGCISCFACKRKDSKYKCMCAINDDLTPVLKKVMDSDAVILGSPIYLGDVSALTRAFLERLVFMNLSYDNKSYSNFTGKINGAFFYTMNVPKPLSLYFNKTYKFNTMMLKRLNGTVKQLLSTNTLQFDDYSKFEASNFNEQKKKKRRENIFPKDCAKAYKIGAELTEI